MLHDLLFALSGHPGNVFMDQGNCFETNRDFHVLCESEREQIDEMLQVGFYYRQLNLFVEENLNRSLLTGTNENIENREPGDSNGGNNAKTSMGKDGSYEDKGEASLTGVDLKDCALQSGVYLRGLCVGVDEQLDKYRSVLVEAERTILKDPKMPLSYLRSITEEYRVLFIALYELLSDMKRRRLRGCQILSLLYEKLQTGVPYVKQAMEEIVFVCNGVMYKQLGSWMVYGTLHDESGEFFIAHSSWGKQKNEEEEKGKEKNLSGVGGGGGGVGPVQSSVMLNQSNGSVISSQLGSLGRDNDGPTKLNWTNILSLRLEYLPSYIPVRVAEKILFIGKALCALKSEGKPLSGSSSLDYNQGFCLPAEDEKTVLSIVNSLRKCPKFSVLSFETSIDKVKKLVSVHLWNLVVKHEGFLFHIETIRDFFLLAKGELFLSFIDSSKHILQGQPSKHSETELNSIFKRIARTLLYANTSESRELAITMENLEVKDSNDTERDLSNRDIANRKVASALKFSGSNSYSGSCLSFEEQERQIDILELKVDLEKRMSGERATASGKRDGLGDMWRRCLSLHIEIESPLDLLFTEELVMKYNELFSFLFYVKRVQMQLQNVWMMSMKREQKRAQSQLFHKLAVSENIEKGGLDEHAEFLASLLRNKMSFLVDNFQFYVQVDVLQPQFNKLIGNVFSETAEEDFEVFRLANEDCINAIWTSCFLTHGPILRCLCEIFNLCLSFSNLYSFTVTKNNTDGSVKPLTSSRKKDETKVTELDAEQLHNMTKLFERQSSLLFKLISGAKNHQANPHLAQLLLRIDFNKFFTSKELPGL
eukprot:Nk52_evm34s296 gene=Nk52_evmTU34s296